jgi:prophage regulatory protein
MSTEETRETPKQKRKITYLPAPLPAEGVVRLPSFLAVLGISKCAFKRGVRQGIIPPGKLLSPRIRVWHVREIREFLTTLESEKRSQ